MIGRRIIKTALAAALTMVLSSLLHLDYPFYAVIAVIVVMQSTLGSSLEAGINRLLGTVIGAVIGALLALSIGSNPLSLGMGVLLTIYLCNLMGLAEAISISGIVLTAVILEQAERPWLFAWGRFIDTMVGIFVAWLVNALLWPPRPEKLMAASLSEILLDQAQYLQELGQNLPEPELVMALRTRLGEKISQCRSFWQESKGEIEPGLLGDDCWQIRLEVVEKIYQYLLILEQLRPGPEYGRVLPVLVAALQQAAAAIASRRHPQLEELGTLQLQPELSHGRSEQSGEELTWSLLQQIIFELQKL